MPAGLRKTILLYRLGIRIWLQQLTSSRCICAPAVRDQSKCVMKNSPPMKALSRRKLRAHPISSVLLLRMKKMSDEKASTTKILYCLKKSQNHFTILKLPLTSWHISVDVVSGSNEKQVTFHSRHKSNVLTYKQQYYILHRLDAYVMLGGSTVICNYTFQQQSNKLSTASAGSNELQSNAVGNFWLSTTDYCTVELVS